MAKPSAGSFSPPQMWFLAGQGMRVLGIGVYAVLILLLMVPIAHQIVGECSDGPCRTATGTPPAARRGRPPRQTPCWRVAGIAPAAVNQRWQIEDNAKGKISTLCSDPSLTPEKKRERIRQINEQTDQEIAKIIPAKQLEVFKTCQAEAGSRKSKAPRGNGAEGTRTMWGRHSCAAKVPQHSHQHQPSNPPNQ